jgi:cell division protein FtsQ
MNSRVLPAQLDRYAPVETAAQGMLRRHPAGTAVVLLVLIVSAIGVHHLMDPHTLPIRHVVVQGEFRHLSLEGLQQRAARVVSGGFFNVNVETIRNVLLQEPWIREVAVKRVWPDRINVLIREQQAIARWNDTGLLNAEGNLFTPDPSTFPDHIPQFRGPSDSYPQMMGFYNRLSGILPEQLRIAGITLSERRAWQVQFVDGPLVRLGRMDIVQRLQRFARLVPTRLHYLLQNMQSVDMRYTNGFAVQWKTDYKPNLQPGRESYGKKSG